MADPHYPAAVWDPGIQAGYHSGHTTMESAVCHYTVGRDSRPIGRQGYFHFLVSRDGTVTQFCEADAVAWHAGDPWNGRGPGIEVEYLDEPDIFTPEASAATGALCDWLTSEWGIPADFYDGARVSAHHGFITHRSLIQTGDQHSDYWPYFPGGSDVPLSEADFDRIALIVTGQVMKLAGGENLDHSYVTTRLIEQKIDALTPGTGGGLTADQVRAIVREELNKTTLKG